MEWFVRNSFITHSEKEGKRDQDKLTHFRYGADSTKEPHCLNPWLAVHLYSPPVPRPPAIHTAFLLIAWIQRSELRFEQGGP